MRSSLFPSHWYTRVFKVTRWLGHCCGARTYWLKIDQGGYNHISKCWTLIRKGRSRCPSTLYWVNTNIYSIILILQRLPSYSVLDLDPIIRTGLLISKGELQSALPYLKTQSSKFDFVPTKQTRTKLLLVTFGQNEQILLRARRVKLLVSVRKVECRTLNRIYLCVCVCVCL